MTEQIKITMEALQKNRMQTFYAETKEDIMPIIKSLIGKGETIAVVGESGSGKSVTARAIMGILAPNAVVEGGEIIYDGKDLMKISEVHIKL